MTGVEDTATSDSARPRRRRSGGLVEEGILQAGALIVTPGIGLLTIVALGKSPAGAIHAVQLGALGSRFAIETTLGNALPTMLVAGAVWLAYASGLFNIGGDGQLQWGALAAVMVSLALKGLPGPLITVLAVLAGMAAGLAWSSIPIIVKLIRGGNELIPGIMLNFAAVLLVNYLVNSPLRSAQSYAPITDQMPGGAQISIYVAFGVSCAVIAAIRLVANGTRVGLTIRAVGANREAAMHAGLANRRVWLAVFLISGACVGLAGALEVAAVQHSVSQGWSLNWGLLGIAVAFLCIREPLFIIGWSLVFGVLEAAGPTLQATISVPGSIVTFILVVPVVAYFAIKRAVAYVAESRFGAMRVARRDAPAASGAA